MTLEYMKELVKIFRTMPEIKFADGMNIIIEAYRQLTTEDQKEFCKWLAGEPPVRGLRATLSIIDDAANMSQEEIDKIVDAFVKT